jgi:hypothetical protein
MRQLASDFANLKPSQARRSLFHFTFPLSAQRCHDVALFLTVGPRRQEMAGAVEIKLKQSERYSQLRALVRERRWKEMSATMSEVADLEEKFGKVLEVT